MFYISFWCDIRSCQSLATVTVSGLQVTLIRPESLSNYEDSQVPQDFASRFKALLVEGVPGIGKSTLIDAMIRRYIDSAGPRKIRTLVHLSQTYTYGPLAPAEDNGTLTVAENLRLLERITGLLE